MEEGMKIIITVLVLLIIGFGVVFILSDRVLNLNDDAKQREENSASGFRGLKCKMTGKEYYTVSLTCGSVCASAGGTASWVTDCGNPAIIPPDFCCCGAGITAKDAVAAPSCCTSDCSPNTIGSDRTKCNLLPADTRKCCCKCG